LDLKLKLTIKTIIKEIVKALTLTYRGNSEKVLNFLLINRKSEKKFKSKLKFSLILTKNHNVIVLLKLKVVNIRLS